MRLYCVIIGLFIFINGALGKNSLPNIDALLKLKNYEFSPSYDSLYRCIWDEDSETALANIKIVREAALKKNLALWILELDYLEFGLYSNRGLLPDSIVLPRLALIEERARSMGAVYIEARTLFMLFRKHWSIEDYGLAMQDIVKLDYLLKTFSYYNFKDRENYLYWMGEAYYFFHDYTTALEYFRRVLEMPSNSHNGFAKMHSLNTTGLIYQYFNKLDSSDFYFEQVRVFCEENDRPHCEGMAFGNLGKNAFLRGDFQEAIPLLEQDFYTAIQHNDYGLASGSGTVLSDIYVRTNRLDKARFYIDTTFSNIHQSGQTYRLRLLYPIMAKYEILTGNPDTALAYLDSARAYLRIYNQNFDYQVVLRLHQRDYIRALTELTAENGRKKTIRRIELFSMGALALFFGYGYYWSRLTEKTKKQLQNIEVQKKEQAYDDAKIQLGFFANKLIQNELLIQSLSKSKATSQDRVDLIDLKKSRIVTDEDWDFFKVKFEKVYCGFLQKLSEKHEGLSQSETRYLSLVMLGLSKNEISVALGISVDSLRVTWYRIRKKLNLEVNMTPEVFVRSIASEGDI